MGIKVQAPKGPTNGSPAGARFCLLVITALLTAREAGTISLTKLAT